MSSKLGSARGAAVKKFTLDKNVNDGLVLLALEDVKVDTITLGDNTKEISFNGKELPRLSFIFRQANAQPGVRPAYYYHSFRPVEHTEDNVLNKQWKYNQIMDYITHFHHVFAGREDYTASELELANFPMEEINEKGEFIPQEADKVIAAWTTFFTGVAQMFNGYGKKPVVLYKKEDGSPKIVWAKLLLYETIKGKVTEVNNGDPGMPNFVGDGTIELYIKGIKSSLRIKLEKGESIDPAMRPVRTAPASNIPNNTSSTATEEDIPDYMRSASSGTDVPY